MNTYRFAIGKTTTEIQADSFLLDPAGDNGLGIAYFYRAPRPGVQHVLIAALCGVSYVRLIENEPDSAAARTVPDQGLPEATVAPDPEPEAQPLTEDDEFRAPPVQPGPEKA